MWAMWSASRSARDPPGPWPSSPPRNGRSPHSSRPPRAAAGGPSPPVPRPPTRSRCRGCSSMPHGRVLAGAGDPPAADERSSLGNSPRWSPPSRPAARTGCSSWPEAWPNDSGGIRRPGAGHGIDTVLAPAAGIGPAGAPLRACSWSFRDSARTMPDEPSARPPRPSPIVTDVASTSRDRLRRRRSRRRPTGLRERAGLASARCRPGRRPRPGRTGR